MNKKRHAILVVATMYGAPLLLRACITMLRASNVAESEVGLALIGRAHKSIHGAGRLDGGCFFTELGLGCKKINLRGG